MKSLHPDFRRILDLASVPDAMAMTCACGGIVQAVRYDQKTIRYFHNGELYTPSAGSDLELFDMVAEIEWGRWDGEDLEEIGEDDGEEA